MPSFLDEQTALKIKGLIQANLFLEESQKEKVLELLKTFTPAQGKALVNFLEKTSKFQETILEEVFSRAPELPEKFIKLAKGEASHQRKKEEQEVKSVEEKEMQILEASFEN